MKHIALAKIGKSIKFHASMYTPHGGDNEAPAVIKALANHNPDKTFYIVGRSDFSRLSHEERIDLFPYNNVIDCYMGSKGPADKNHVIDWLNKNNINIDFGFMLIGQVGTVIIPDIIKQIKNPDLIASIIDMTRNYSTPVVKWLNEQPIKWIEIVNDPRYTRAQSRDFIGEPLKTLSQYDYTYTHKRIKSYEDQEIIVVNQEVEYAGMETPFCINTPYPNDISNIQKTTKFAIVLNEGKPSRYNNLKEWVLNNFDDIEIYGQWDDKIVEADSRFMGSLHIDKIQHKMRNVKYTFIIPIAPGWVTSKYIEMINVGCIPFFHPSYDAQKHIPVPELLRVSTPAELLKNIETLEKDDDLRKDILRELQNNILKPGYYDGSFINDKLMGEAYSCIGQTYNQCDMDKYTKEGVIRLI